MINSNQLLLIIVLLICIPTVLMSANPSKDIGIDTPVATKFKSPLSTSKITTLKTAFGLHIGDSYYDVRVKLPHYKIKAELNTPIIIESGAFTFTLNETAKPNTDKYHISNDAKITKIKRLN